MHPLCHKRADASNRAMVGIPFLLVVYFSGPLDWDAGTRDGPLLDNFYLDCSYPLLDEIQFLSHSSGHVYKTISGHRPQSLTVASTLLPFFVFVILTLVPQGRLLCAAVSSDASYLPPQAVL